VDIAAAIGYPVAFVEQLLRDEQARGNVERAGDGWRLTASARERFSPLRGIAPERPWEPFSGLETDGGNVPSRGRRAVGGP
jgi:hypothetical protein